MKRLLILSLLILTACGPVVNQYEPAYSETLGPIATEPDSSPTEIPAAQADSANSAADIFSALPAPACNGVLTPENMEGPYYTADTPEKNSLLEEGMQGDRLILIGYVLYVNCQPVANAWLDFWQADANGEYDNAGYTLRGHQFTDEQGRYYLETVLPGLYSSRPISHIHVKAQLPGGEVMTTQLYFPEQPVENLTVQMQDAGEYYLGLFNFVLK